jgi:hypothetical protein
MTVFVVLEPRVGSMSRAFITEFGVLEGKRGFEFWAFMSFYDRIRGTLVFVC